MFASRRSLVCAVWLTGHLWAAVTCGADQPGEGEVRRLTGHTNKVSSLALSADGKLLVSGSDDMTVRLWNLENGQELKRFEGHTNFVLSVAISADGRHVLSGSGGEFVEGRFQPGTDRGARLWDVDTGKELRRLEGHGAPVWSVRFLADAISAITVTGDSEYALRVWNLSEGKATRRIGQRHSGQGTAVSPDGRLVLTGSAPSDTSVRLWQVETGRELKRLTGHGAMVRGAAISPDGTLALTGGGNFVSGGHDASLRLWDLETGQERHRFVGHEQLVWCVAFSPDGKRAASGSVDGTIRVWDLTTNEELRRLRGHAVTENDPRVGERADVRAVLFTPDGRHLISAGHDKTIRVWELPQ